MLTPINDKTHEYRCLSADVTYNSDGSITPKKTLEVVGNGSFILIMDTLKVFMYDEENKKWLPLTK